MSGHECYHCKQWVGAGQAHDCWTTTEAALTRDLSDDLRDAWERLRETAADFGEQRIYASHNSIMFARKACYFFVRPRPTGLEVCFFLGRTIHAPQIRRVEPASKVKTVHIVRVRHRDEVEAPLTEWLREAYELQDTLAAARESQLVKRAGRAAAKSERPPAKARQPASTKSRPATAKAPRGKQAATGASHPAATLTRRQTPAKVRRTGKASVGRAAARR